MIAYGARCSWWDDKENVAIRDGGLPCCPYCRNVLFEMDNSDWDRQAIEYDKSHPGYLALLAWSKGRCFPNWTAAKLAYEGAHS